MFFHHKSRINDACSVPDCGGPVTMVLCNLSGSYHQAPFLSCVLRYPVCSRNSHQPCLDPPKSELHDGQRQIKEAANILGKVQPYERNYEVAFVFRRATRLCE